MCIIDTLHKQGGKADLHHECYRVPLHCMCVCIYLNQATWPIQTLHKQIMQN